MDKDKSLQVRKENIFTKFLNFFKNLFKPKKQELGYIQQDIILEKERVQNIVTPEVKKDFKSEIKIGQENNELLYLQKKFENNEVTISSMSNEQIRDLIILYKEQVRNLKAKINEKKSELNTRKSKLENYSVNI